MKVLLLSVFVALLLGIVLVPAAFEQASAQTVGLKEGQWVKYTVDCRAYAFISDEEQKKKLKDKLDEDCSKSMKQRYGVTNVDNIEWYKVKVSKIDGTKVTFDESIKVRGSAEKSMERSVIDIASYGDLPEWAIPVGLRVGDQIPTPENYSPLKVYEIKNISEDILWKDEGFENVEFLYLISENRIILSESDNVLSIHIYNESKYNHQFNYSLSDERNWLESLNDTLFINAQKDTTIYLKLILMKIQSLL